MPGEARPRIVIYYADRNGYEPFLHWLEDLAISFQDRILRRLQRVQLGNFGDRKWITGNIQELRFHFGKGYRIYFAEDEGNSVVLLCGGDKDTQSKDIRKANVYWQDYLNQKQQ